MAKGKNEILLSIALEGDQDVKAKLKAVGDEGKKSLADIERQVGKAGEGIGRRFAESAAAPVSKLREAIAPILEGAGLGQLGAGLASGGLLSRIFGVAGPAAAIAALGGIAVRLAKVREETEKTDARLSGFGGSKDVAGKLNASANKLGVDPKSIEGDLADFLATRRRALAEQSGVIHPPGFVPPENQTPLPQVFAGGKLVSGASATEDQFLAAREALISGARLDKQSPGEAQDPISQLLKGVSGGGLTGDLLRQFSTALPNDANLLSKVLGPAVSRGFGNSDELAKFLDQNGPIGADKVFGRLSKEAPQIEKDAGEKGLSASFESLTASVKRVDTAFGNLAGGPLGKLVGGGLDKAAEVINKGADKVPGLDRQVRAAEYAPGGKEFLGPMRPGDVPTAPKSLGEVFSSDKGDLLGRIVGFIRGGESGQNNGFGGANPFGAISDFLSKAFTNPAALQEKQRPVEGPSAAQPIPVQPVPTQPQSSAFDSFIENLNAKINSGNQQNLKVDTPASGLGIRGSLEDPSQSVAAVKDAGAQLAAAIAEVAANIKNSAAPAAKTETTEPAKAAGGGMIRRFIGGGGVSGPGSSTSDSIPAMLSDGEYVIKAESARKLGRGALDWLNAGHYADGGEAKDENGNPPWWQAVVKKREEDWARRENEKKKERFDNWVVKGGARVVGDPVRTVASEDKVVGAGDFGKEFDPERWQLYATDYNKAAGGPIGRFAGGGTVSFPGFDIGGPAMMSDAPSLADLGGAGGGESLHPVTINFEGRPVGGLRAPGDVVDTLRKEARDSANFQTGQAPSWAHGS